MSERRYSTSDEDLVIHAGYIHRLLTYNLDSFSGVHITEAVLADFYAITLKAVLLSLDKEVRSRAATSKKKSSELYGKMTEFARTLRKIIGFTYGKSSQLYAELDTRGMNDTNQEESLERVRIIHARLTEVLPEIPEAHISQQLLDEFFAAIEEYAAARKDYLGKKTKRTPAKNDRINAHNAVYDELLRLTELARPKLYEQGNFNAAEKMKAVPDKYIRRQKRSRKKAAQKINNEAGGETPE